MFAFLREREKVFTISPRVTGKRVLLSTSLPLTAETNASSGRERKLDGGNVAGFYARGMHTFSARSSARGQKVSGIRRSK